MANGGIHMFQIKTVDQIGYVVRDIDKTIDTWTKLFGMGPWRHSESGGLDAKGRPWKVKLAIAYLGPVQIELIQCAEGRVFQSRYLDKWGEGVHHLGFYVDDVDAEAANLKAQGVKIFVHDPGRFAYFDAGGDDGAIFELIRRPA